MHTHTTNNLHSSLRYSPAAHIHSMSQYLTLQGAIAHVDMPIESGPTTFLPYSQNFERNYLTWRDEEVRQSEERSDELANNAISSDENRASS